MGDVLLVNSYMLTKDFKEQRIMKPYPPLGLLYLSAYLKAKGHGVEIFDGTFKEAEDYLSVLRKRKPAIVGIYASVITRLNAFGMAKAAKEAGATVIAGGPDPVLYASPYFKNSVDVIVAGEGEKTLAELIGEIEGRRLVNLGEIDGLVFPRNGRIQKTKSRRLIQDLDSIPFPDWEAVELERYLWAWKSRHGRSSLSIMASRGCPFKCTWCSKAVFGDSFRQRRPYQVVKEMLQIKEKYDPDQIWFADDVFTINKKWTLEFCREVKKKGIEMPFECLTRVDLVDEEILKGLKSIGCFRIWYGTESGSQRVRDLMSKGVTLEEIVKASRRTKEAGIELGYFVMLGYPGEKKADIQRTVEMLMMTDPDYCGPSVAYPIRGTQFYEAVKSKITVKGEWQETNENRLTFKGRYPRIFYWFAIRLVMNQWRLAKALKREKRDWKEIVERGVKVIISKMGFHLTGFNFGG